MRMRWLACASAYALPGFLNVVCAWRCSASRVMLQEFLVLVFVVVFFLNNQSW